MKKSNDSISSDLLKKLNQIGDNDPDFIKQLIAIFCKNAKKSMAELNQHDTLINITEKQQIAHKLKSNFQLLGFLEAEETAIQIEKSNSIKEINTLTSKLNQLVPDILQELSHYPS